MSKSTFPSGHSEGQSPAPPHLIPSVVQSTLRKNLGRPGEDLAMTVLKQVIPRRNPKFEMNYKLEKQLYIHYVEMFLFSTRSLFRCFGACVLLCAGRVFKAAGVCWIRLGSRWGDLGAILGPFWGHFGAICWLIIVSLFRERLCSYTRALG